MSFPFPFCPCIFIFVHAFSLLSLHFHKNIKTCQGILKNYVMFDINLLNISVFSSEKRRNATFHPQRDLQTSLVVNILNSLQNLKQSYVLSR